MSRSIHFYRLLSYSLDAIIGHFTDIRNQIIALILIKYIGYVIFKSTQVKTLHAVT
jgi:hypothetical protein